MNKRRQRWMLAFLWMAVIFYLSSQDGQQSSSLSTSLFKPLFDIVVPMGVSADILSLIIRKTAHFVTYFILGVLIFRAMDTYELNLSQKIYLSVIFCIGYAISDEIHQLFVPGRSCNLTDVIVDTMGSISSITISGKLRRKEVRT